MARIFIIFSVLSCAILGCIQQREVKGVKEDLRFYWECNNVNIEPSEFYFLYVFGTCYLANNSKDTLVLKTSEAPLKSQELVLYMNLGKDTLTLRSFLDDSEKNLIIAPRDTVVLEMDLAGFNFSGLYHDSLTYDSNYVYGQVTSRRVQRIINYGNLFYYAPDFDSQKKDRKRYLNYVSIPKKNKSDTCFIVIPREY